MNTIKVIIVVLLFNIFCILSITASWVPMPPHPTQVLDKSIIIGDMDVLDSTNAMALVNSTGLHTEIWYSSDGWETIQVLFSEELPGSNPRLNDLQYMSKNHIFFYWRELLQHPETNIGNRIRHSKDGGKTFDTLLIVNEYISNNAYVQFFRMYDTLVGIVSCLFSVSNENRNYNTTSMIIYTDDAWQTTKYIRPDTFFNENIFITDFHFFSPIHFGVVLSKIGGDIPHIWQPADPYFIWTEDGGKTWERFNLASIEGVKDHQTGQYAGWDKLFFFNDTLGWLAGGRVRMIGDTQTDAILKTTDGGKTWELNYMQDNYPMFGLWDIAFKDEMNGIAVGNHCKILRTTDGGKTWAQEYCNDDSNIHNTVLLARAGISYIGSKPIIRFSPDPKHLFWKEKGTSVIEPLLLTSAQVYPNPATDANTTVTVDLETAGNLTVTLNNMLGQELLEIYNGFTVEGTFTKTFSLKELPIGVYYLKIVHNGNVRVEKVVRN